MKEHNETRVQSLRWKDPPEGGHGNPLQYSCLENPLDRGLCRATLHGVTKSRTWMKQLSWSTQWPTPNLCSFLLLQVPGFLSNSYCPEAFMFPLDHISSPRPFFSNESKLQAVVKYSSCAGQAFQGVTPQSEDANGCDEAPDVGLATALGKEMELQGRIHAEPGSTLFPEESSGYKCMWLKFRVLGQSPWEILWSRISHPSWPLASVNILDQGSENYGLWAK